MFDLVNWIPFNTKTNNNYNFDVFIDTIKELDKNSSPNTWVKWKDDSNQLVVGTDNYFYKIYQNDIQAGLFIVKIREILANLYNSLYNIHWCIKTIYKDNMIYQIEQREKLKVCDDNIDFSDILLNWNKTLVLLEEKLLLDKVTKQLKEYIPNLYKIKLVRDCMNKNNDYALLDSNDIILLDDADWFLALVDVEGNWLSIKSQSIDILSILGESFFAPLDFYDRIKINQAEEKVNKWNIFTSNTIEKHNTSEFISKREEILANNIKQLTLNKKQNNFIKLENTLKNH